MKSESIPVAQPKPDSALPEWGHLKLGLGAKAPGDAQRAAGIRTDSVIGTMLLKRHMMAAKSDDGARKRETYVAAPSQDAEESRVRAIGSRNPMALPAPVASKKKRGNKEHLSL